MKRTEYNGYVIDTDSLGRPYIYNTASPHSEDIDHIFVYADGMDQVKAIIDARIKYGQDIRHYTDFA